MSSKKGGGASCSAIWFAGWLFSIGFLKLIWWKALLGIIVWPWYLGNALAAKFWTP